MMHDTQNDELLIDLAAVVDEYTVSKKEVLLKSIEEKIEQIFQINYSLLWQYDSVKNRVINISDSRMVLELKNSLLQDVLTQKSPLMENYLMSHKSYVHSLDNPFDKSLKSMVVYPISEKKNILGFLVLAVETKMDSTFERQIFYTLDRVHDILVPLFLQENSKEERAREESSISNDADRRKIKALEDEVNVLKLQKKIFDDTYQDNTETNSIIKKEVEMLRDQNSMLSRENTVLLEKVKSLEESRQDDSEFKKLQIGEKISQKQVSYLESKIKILELENENLLNQKEQDTDRLKNDSALDIEKMLPAVSRYRHIYIMYEYIMYESQISNMRMLEIDEKVEKSRLLWEFFKDIEDIDLIPLSVKPTNFKIFVSKLEMLEIVLAGEHVGVRVDVSEALPSSLMFDSDKVLSICLHLIYDILEFVKAKEELVLRLDYADGSLLLSIEGKKCPSLDTFLNKNKFTIESKKRVDLIMGKKLLNILLGKVESYIDDVHCVHQLTIPTKRI